MSAEVCWLALRLEGPLQSWGLDSQYSRRATGLMPTKSGIAGICCAAIGLPRGSEAEREFLAAFGGVRLVTIALPRSPRRRRLEVRRMQDYHTVQGTMKADGKLKDCQPTYRQYLADASFGALLEGDAAVLGQVATALSDPRWGIWLGRKCCIPTAPVLAGCFSSQREAEKALLGDEPLESFTRQEEVTRYPEGRDSLPDQAVTFLSTGRRFSPRRVRTLQGR